MARLFLSYRRSDTGAYADRLAERLGAFQFEAVFLDREAIGLGDNFADDIRASLAQCTAVLVLIGKNWIDAQDEGGRRRLEDPTDWVRREVTLALGMGLRVIPIFFDAARKPAAAELPGDLSFLATKEGYDINGNYFKRDADDLGTLLEKKFVAADRATTPGPASTSGATLVRTYLLICAALSAITVAAAVVPALPQLFWLVPGAMTLAAFTWYLYWLGESSRPARSRMA